MQFVKFLCVLAFVGLLLSGCTSKDDHNGHEGHDHGNGHNHSSSVSENAETVWTCHMHPEVRKSEPGLCPECNMELVKAENN